jgi:glyoxylase-like metal-dependent hydrolase (beta-lactamase superfamily II)
VALGRAVWQVLAAPGHDPDAVMLFQPDEKVLIAGDALWEDGVAILFPELDGAPGLAPAAGVLDAIERLAPAWVIPGHGAPFGPAAASVERARQRLERFAREPARHRDYAARALVMFHMLEFGERPLAELVRWMLSVPLFEHIAAGVDAGAPREQWAMAAVQRLIDGGALQRRDDTVRVPR